MKTSIVILAVALMAVGVAGYMLQENKISVPTQEQPIPEPESEEVVANVDEVPVNTPTERYSAQVDRVKVLFEQWDYIRYRLQTNELVREGEMNTERGFGDDPDATVYVLNWQAPAGEQIRYVRLTAEPRYLYALDGYQNIIKSGRLELDI